MAFLGKPKDQEQYGRLMGMIAPEATPAKRIGTEAPTGSVAAGPAAGKSAAEFTQTTKASPGSVFSRQLQGANIQGITGLAEKPLTREAEQESGRMKEAASQYGQAREAEVKEQPQFDFSKSDLANKIAAGGEEFGTAQNIMGRKEIPVAKFDAGEVKEFTRLIVNSSATRDALTDFASRRGWPVPPCVIAPPASTYLPTPAAISPLAESYFVVLGTIEPRKNDLLLLQLWRRLAEELEEAAPRLVVIGQRGWEWSRCWICWNAVRPCSGWLWNNRAATTGTVNLAAPCPSVAVPFLCRGIRYPLSGGLVAWCPGHCQRSTGVPRNRAGHSRLPRSQRLARMETISSELRSLLNAFEKELGRI